MEGPTARLDPGPGIALKPFGSTFATTDKLIAQALAMNLWQEAKGQFTTPTYVYRDGRILIEIKAEIKRLGNSPDRADAYAKDDSFED